MVKWIVALALSLQAGLSAIAVEFDGLASTDAINYGYLPKVSSDQITNRAFSAWIYPDTVNGGLGNIFAPFSDENGIDIYLLTDSTYLYPSLYSKRFSDVAQWYANTALTPGAGWYHILVVYDHSSPSNNPVFYANNTLGSVTEALTPAGTAKSEIGCNFVVGNWKTATQNYDGAFDGKIFDPRVYDMDTVGMTAAQLSAALYNGGTKDATIGPYTGLVFQGFIVQTGSLSSYVDGTLTSTLTVRDNMFGAVGFPNGSPIGRSAP